MSFCVSVSNGVEARVVQAMKLLGFTATDARTYVALLKEHPASGYELAARSGVPRSAIYNVLRNMAAHGLVNAIQAKPSRYVPLAPEKLLALLESRFSKSLGDLKSGIEALSGPAVDATTWPIKGYAQMLEQAEGLISKSARSVYASLWAREAEQLAIPLKRAVAAGVDVVLFSFNPIPHPVGRVLSYGIAESELEPYWPHKIILISDHARLLVGGAEASEHNRALLTEEPSLIEIAISNMVLDITLLGQRRAVHTGEVVSSLTKLLAPVEDLLRRRS